MARVQRPAAAEGGQRVGWGDPRGQRELVRGDRDANHPERISTAGGTLGVTRGEPACDVLVDGGGAWFEGELRRPVGFAKAGDEHAACRRTLRPIPCTRGLGRDAQQIAKLEIARIDAVIGGATCPERECDVDRTTPR